MLDNKFLLYVSYIYDISNLIV